MVFAALEATIDLHLDKTTEEVPALHLLSLPNEQLRTRGEALLERLRALPLGCVWWKARPRSAAALCRAR